MKDRQKTIEELERLVSVLSDSLALLKRQGPVKPVLYSEGLCLKCECGVCGKHLVNANYARDNYCSKCGAEVDWEG